MSKSVIRIGNYSYFPAQILGQGATGSVFMGFRNQGMLPVAVKTIKLEQINTDVKKHLLGCEVAGLRSVKGRFICHAYDVLKDGQFYFVPMEYCPRGTLREYIISKIKLTQNQSLQIFCKLLEGYCSILEAGFFHRDLKTDNVLLRDNFDPAIIDLGYCQRINTQGQKLTYNVGSPGYMAPQAYNQNIYSQKSDIWALGIILHEMVTGTVPIAKANDIDQYFSNLKLKETAEITYTNNQLVNTLLKHCLTVDLQRRFGVRDIQNLIRGYPHFQSNQQIRPNTSYQISTIQHKSSLQNPLHPQSHLQMTPITKKKSLPDYIDYSANRQTINISSQFTKNTKYSLMHNRSSTADSSQYQSQEKQGRQMEPMQMKKIIFNGVEMGLSQINGSQGPRLRKVHSTQIVNYGKIYY